MRKPLLEMPVKLVQIVTRPEHKMIFSEIMETLQAGFAELNVPIERLENELDRQALNILIGSTMFLPNDFVCYARSHNYLVYQVEALSWKAGFLPKYGHYIQLLQQACAVWDYSITHLKFLAEQGINHVCHLPSCYHPLLSNFPDAAPQDIDVIVCGAITPRRQAIIEALRAEGVVVETPFGVYGDERNRLIARAKINLNIHQDDGWHTLEEFRLGLLLANRCFIISETADHNPYSDGVVFCDYQDLVKTCLHYLALPEERRRIANRGYEHFSQQLLLPRLTAVLQNTQSLITEKSSRCLKIVPPPSPPYYQSGIEDNLPREAERILDIGGVSAHFSPSLTQRDGHKVHLTTITLSYDENDDVLRQLRDLPSNTFDAVLIAEALSYTDKVDEVLRQIYRCLKEYGKLIWLIVNVSCVRYIKDCLDGRWRLPKAEGRGDEMSTCFTLEKSVHYLSRWHFYVERVQGNVRHAEKIDAPLKFRYPDELHFTEYLIVASPYQSSSIDSDNLLTLRALLYQAEYYDELGLKKTALRYYQRLMELPGSYPEIAAAFQKTASIQERYSYADQDTIVANYLQAYQRQPQRADALIALARLYRVRQQYVLAHLYSQQAVSIEHTNWRALDEYAIASYWVGDYVTSEKCNRRLLKHPQLPDAQRARIIDNLNWALRQQQKPVYQPVNVLSQPSSRVPCLSVSEIVRQWININHYRSLLQLTKTINSDFAADVAVPEKACYVVDFHPWRESIPIAEQAIIDSVTSPNFLLTEDNWQSCFAGRKWDVIIFDVYHIRDCVQLWLNRCIQHLSSNGVLLMHDVLPQDNALIQRNVDIGPCCGETYKIWRALCQRYPELYAVDDDMGVGVGIIPGRLVQSWQFDELMIEDTLSWEQYISRKAELSHYRGLLVFPIPSARSGCELTTHNTAATPRCSVIIPYRYSDAQRAVNLQRVLSWWSETDDIEILVVELDNQPRVQSESIRHIFVNHVGAFNRSWACNVGLLHAKSNYLVFADADVFFSKETFERALTALQHVDCVRPFSRLIDLTAEETDWSWDRLQQIKRPGRGEMDHQKLSIASTVIFFNRDAILKIGGWSTQFWGWGCEGDFQSLKIQRMLSWQVLPDAAYHLWHDRSRSNDNGYLINFKLYKHLESLEPSALELLIQQEAQLMELT